MSAKHDWKTYAPDLTQPLSFVDMARCTGLNKSSITRGVKSGLLIADDDNFINLTVPKNRLYFEKHLFQAGVWLWKIEDPDEMEFIRRLFQKLFPGVIPAAVDCTPDDDTGDVIEYDWNKIPVTPDDDTGDVNFIEYEICSFDDDGLKVWCTVSKFEDGNFVIEIKPGENAVNVFIGDNKIQGISRNHEPVFFLYMRPKP